MGKGSFAKVILSLRIADKQEFAVKTFNKFKLTSKSNKNSDKKQPSNIYMNSPLRKQGNFDMDDSPTGMNYEDQE